MKQNKSITFTWGLLFVENKFENTKLYKMHHLSTFKFKIAILISGFDWISLLKKLSAQGHFSKIN